MLTALNPATFHEQWQTITTFTDHTVGDNTSNLNSASRWASSSSDFFLYFFQNRTFGDVAQVFYRPFALPVNQPTV